MSRGVGVYTLGSLRRVTVGRPKLEVGATVPGDVDVGTEEGPPGAARVDGATETLVAVHPEGGRKDVSIHRSFPRLSHPVTDPPLRPRRSL